MGALTAVALWWTSLPWVLEEQWGIIGITPGPFHVYVRGIETWSGRCVAVLDGAVLAASLWSFLWPLGRRLRMLTFCCSLAAIVCVVAESSEWYVNPGTVLGGAPVVLAANAMIVTLAWPRRQPRGVPVG